MLFSSCLGTRYLKPGEKLLYRQKIEAPKSFNKQPLSDLYAEKTNRRFLGLPINTLVWMYYTGQKRYHQEKYIDKKEKVTARFDRKIEKANAEKRKSSLQYRKQRKLDALDGKIENGNLFMQWGEKAAVFDTTNTNLTSERFNDYLFTKGYFRSQVKWKATGRKLRGGLFSRKSVIFLTFYVSPGPRYTYDSISYHIPDSTIASIVNQRPSARLIKKSDPFDQEKLNQERERIDNLLKDNGYFTFSREYIDYDIDTAYRDGFRMAIRLNINNPGRSQRHKQYKLDSIIFVTDASTTGVGSQGGLKRQSRVFRDITYSYYKNQYSTRVLSQRVFLHKDSLYSRSATLNTQRQLANLAVFKFVNINYDTTGGKFIANLFSSPLNRYSWSNEAGLTVTQGFPGPYYNMSFMKRNLFGGLEIFELNGRFGFEGVAPATEDADVYKSVTGNVHASITFPQFLFPMSAAAVTRLGKYNPKTKLLAGYTYTDRPEYNRRTTTFSHTYTWENQRTSQYSFTIGNLNIIRSTINPVTKFDSVLSALQAQGNNLINTFKPSLVSSMIFSWTWNPDEYGNTERNSLYLRTSVESGGTLLNFIELGSNESIQGLQLYKYLRFNVDVRRNRIINANTILAYRLNTGVAWSYIEGNFLPYEKYFFAGGSNSVRAWRPRRLGIGSSPPILSDNEREEGLFDYSFEKPGEILIEGSVELRQKLFGFVSGAVFLDWGNVWSFQEIRQDSTATEPLARGSTKFRLENFYKEFGIGTGVGLRFDFSFLVLRLDAGIKVYDPARAAGDRFVLDNVKFFRPFGFGREPVIFNVGIGYPF